MIYYTVRQVGTNLFVGKKDSTSAFQSDQHLQGAKPRPWYLMTQKHAKVWTTRKALKALVSMAEGRGNTHTYSNYEVVASDGTVTPLDQFRTETPPKQTVVVQPDARLAREIQFKTAPSCLVEALQMNLEAAMQIIAALVLTDDEATEMQATVEGCDPTWVKDMRKDLLSPQWRPELIKAIRHQGFLTNTHPGFCVTPLLQTPTDIWTLIDIYQALEGMLQAQARGEGADVPAAAVMDVYWSEQLVQVGFDPELSRYAMMNEGAMLACLAELERLMWKAGKIRPA